MKIDEMLLTLARASGDAILICDAEGRLIYWNEGAERIFRYRAADVIGRSLDIIIPAAQRARHWEGYHETIRSGHTAYGAEDLLAVPAETADKRRISIEFSITPLRNTTGAIVAIGAVIRDVTRAFEERKALRRRLAEAERQRETSARA